MSNRIINPEAPPRWIERRAKLFEAGDYPDKGVTVTDAHLDGLVASFGEPVPILIEHAESPLEIGFLSAVAREGNELFGTVSLSPEAEALVEASGAKSLSLGLAGDLSCIREVSLVRNPRIASAQLFRAEVTFVGHVAPSALAQEWRRLRTAQAEHEIADLVREGRITPAQAAIAVPLLLCEATVAFGEDDPPIGQLVREFLRCQPRRALFGELTPTGTRSDVALSPEAAAFYRRHFPDLQLEEIARNQ